MNPAMTWEKFWSIIDRVRAQADMQDEASVNQFLYTELINLPQDELLGFDCAWQSYRNKANFPKMVAAACIINDGSSDDRFTDFRNWLIMQGYDAYRQALIGPDNLAALNIPFRDTEWMGCGNVAWYAYAGQKLHTYFEKEGIAAKLFRKYPALLKSSADLHQAIMQEQLAPCRAPETEWERQMLRTEVKHYIDERDRKGSVETTQEVEIYFNFIGRYLPPHFGEVKMTPEEIEEMEKREARKDRLHQNYLRRKANGKQQEYYERTKAKKKAELDAKKEEIRQEDIAKGVFIPLSLLPPAEPKKGVASA